MNVIPKHLSSGLEIHQSMNVEKLNYEDLTWQLVMESGEVFSCQELVLTPPLPQVVNLLEGSNLLNQIMNYKKLTSVDYQKGLSLMLVLEKHSLIPKPGYLKLENDLVSWIADNSKKGLTSEHTCVTLQAQPDFAKEHWNSLDAVRGSLMIEAAKAYLGSEVTDFHCHRWGYAFAKNPIKATHIRDEALAISFAGDGFGKSRVESAALSGVLAAEEIIQSNKFLGS